MKDTNNVKTLEIGSTVDVDGFGICSVKKLAFDGFLSKHYFATTKFGDRIRIQYSQH